MKTKLWPNVHAHILYTGLLLLSLLATGCQSQSEAHYTVTDEEIKATVTELFRTYPHAQLRDVYKSCFQDLYGPGHLVTDSVSAMHYLEKEWEEVAPGQGLVYEPTGLTGRYVRVYLRAVTEGAISPEQLVSAFLQSAAQIDSIPIKEWQKIWKRVEKEVIRQQPTLPRFAEDRDKIDQMLAEGHYQLSHSNVYRDAYAPHYRLVERELFEEKLKPELDLLAQADSTGFLVRDGDIAPDFTATKADGTTFRLSDQRGKVVMLQFTASWCGVCRKEMPFIERDIWQKYGLRDDFVLLGIDRDEPLATVERFAEQTGITYPLALDPGADIFARYALRNAGITRNVLIGRDGKVICRTRLYHPEEFAALVRTIDQALQ